MKPGSLVVCIDNNTYLEMPCTIPQLEPAVYTVRMIDICNCGGPNCQKSGILLEEIKTFIGGREMMYDIKDFREVLPAENIHLEEILGKELTYD